MNKISARDGRRFALFWRLHSRIRFNKILPSSQWHPGVIIIWDYLLTEAGAKWPPFCRQQYRTHFLELSFYYIDESFTDAFLTALTIYSIESDNSVVIIWANNILVHWRIYVTWPQWFIFSIKIYWILLTFLCWKRNIPSEINTAHRGNPVKYQIDRTTLTIHLTTSRFNGI